MFYEPILCSSNRFIDHPTKVGKESKFVNGLRYTDDETMEIVQMVLTGKLNKEIVGLLLQEGGKAVGLSGVDSGLLRAKKIQKDWTFQKYGLYCIPSRGVIAKRLGSGLQNRDSVVQIHSVPPIFY